MKFASLAGGDGTTGAPSLGALVGIAKPHHNIAMAAIAAWVEYSAVPSACRGACARALSLLMRAHLCPSPVCGCDAPTCVCLCVYVHTSYT